MSNLLNPLSKSPLDRLTFRQVSVAFAIAYALHILEEFPRFIEWTHRYPALYGEAMDVTTFWVGDSMFIAYVAVALTCLFKAPERGGIIAALSLPAWALTNSAAHLCLTLISGVYSPGSITAAALYLPLSLLAYDRAYRENLLDKRRVILSILLGVGVQVSVVALGHAVE